jgi:ketosteroid isomerase-like protein
MASAHLDLVRSLNAALERDDFAGMAAWVHPKIEFIAADGPQPGLVAIGLERFAEVWREYLSTWEGYRFVVDELRELDDERILERFHFSGRGKTSRVDLGQLRSHGAAVFHIHEGKLTRIVRYWNFDRALADLGLGSEAGSSRERSFGGRPPRSGALLLRG